MTDSQSLSTLVNTLPADRSEPRAAIRAEGITKRFGSVRALRGVNIEIFPGEVVGLVGDNGAGKSTLVNVLAGVVKPDSGTIFIDGVEQSIASPADARRLGIETVFQNLSLIPTLNIEENIFLNREMSRRGPLRFLRIMDKSAMRKRVATNFERLELTLPHPRTLASSLSGGQRQAVAVARAVMWGGHVMLLDEPSAALGMRQTEIVLSLVERLKRHRVAVVFISHNLPQVMRVADRIVVMRLGHKVMDAATSLVTASEIVMRMTGAPLRDGEERVET
jgi:ABC-type sugar transport system ATPase subunit